MDSIKTSDLESLPPTIPLLRAAEMFGMGRTKAYALARKNQFPCKVIIVGCSYRVSTRDLIRVVGSSEPPERGRTGPSRIR